MPLVVGDQGRVGLDGEPVGQVEGAGGQRCHVAGSSRRAGGHGRRWCGTTGALRQAPGGVLQRRGETSPVRCPGAGSFAPPRAHLPKESEDYRRSRWDRGPPTCSATGYQQRVFDLGDAIPTARVRSRPCSCDVRSATASRSPVPWAYVHGFSDYFFQTDLADFLAERGLAVYALDLRKSGRAGSPARRRTSCRTSRATTPSCRWRSTWSPAWRSSRASRSTVMAHSTGGLITPAVAGPTAPQGQGRAGGGPGAEQPVVRPAGQAGGCAGRSPGCCASSRRVQPFRRLELRGRSPSTARASLHRSVHARTSTSTWKPLATVGWLNAVRRGHARLHRGLDVGVPSLVLRSEQDALLEDPTARRDPPGRHRARRPPDRALVRLPRRRGHLRPDRGRPPRRVPVARGAPARGLRAARRLAGHAPLDQGRPIRPRPVPRRRCRNRCRAGCRPGR